MNVNNRPVQSINQYLNITKSPARNSLTQSGEDFSAILNQKLYENRDVKISKHAAMRLSERDISLTNEQVERLKSAVDKASEKGVRDSLVVMDDIAMVVTVKNRTVITAVNQNELKENVFTNIDGAVFT
jgi:flagellar operon protein